MPSKEDKTIQISKNLTSKKTSDLSFSFSSVDLQKLNFNKTKKKKTPKVEFVVNLSNANTIADISQQSGKSLKELKYVCSKKLGLTLRDGKYLDLEEARILLEYLNVRYKNSNKIEKKTKIEDEIALRAQKKCKMHVKIGILGHIDHGKTSLLRLMLGEKAPGKEVRGITQKSNFFLLEEGVFIVDTPGHNVFEYTRRIIVDNIDIGFLVVSAKNGVQKETKDIARLLMEKGFIYGANMGVVLTKCDLSSKQEIESTKAQLRTIGINPSQAPDFLLLHFNTEKTAKAVKKQILDIVKVHQTQEAFADGNGKGVLFDRCYHKDTCLDVVDHHGGESKFGERCVIQGKVYKLREIRDVCFKKLSSMSGPGIYLVSFSPKIPLKTWERVDYMSFRKTDDVDGFLAAKASEVEAPKVAVANAVEEGAEDAEKLFLVSSENSTLFSLRGFVEGTKGNLVRVVAATTDFQEKDFIPHSGYKYVFFNYEVPKKLLQSMKGHVFSFDNIYDLEKFVDEIARKKAEQKYSYAKIIRTFLKDGENIAGCSMEKGEIALEDEVCIVPDLTQINGPKAKVVSLKIKRSNVAKVSKGDEFGVILSNKGAHIKIGGIVLKK